MKTHLKKVILTFISLLFVLTFVITPNLASATQTAPNRTCPVDGTAMIWETCVTVKVEMAAVSKGVTIIKFWNADIGGGEDGIWNTVYMGKDANYYYYTQIINRAAGNNFSMKYFQDQNTLPSSMKFLFEKPVQIYGEKISFTVTASDVGGVAPVIGPGATTGAAKAQLSYQLKCNRAVSAVSSLDDAAYSIVLTKTTGASKVYNFDSSNAPIDLNGYLTFLDLEPGKYNINSTLTMKNATYDCDPSGPRYNIKYHFSASPLTAVSAATTVDWGMMKSTFVKATKIPSSTTGGTTSLSGDYQSDLFKECKSSSSTDPLICWISAVWDWARTAVFVSAVTVIVFAGLVYMTSAGNVKQTTLAKKLLVGALSGVIVVVLGQLFVTTVLGIKWLL